MSFGNPQILWLIPVVLPLLTWFLWLAWRKRRHLMAQFVQSRLLAQLTVGVSARWQILRQALLVLAVGFLLLTLASPRWGFQWEEAKRRGLDIVVAVDTSRSMLAEDISPNRLARAKLAALDLLKLAKSDRLGLVAFAGTAFLQCPLTLDDEAYRQSVNLLQVGLLPQGGTAITEAIRTAQSAFKDGGDNDKVLVLFTDGEDQDTGAAEAAEAASREGMRIFTVGVGTPKGELLRQRNERSGQVEPIKDDAGQPVMSRLNEALLQQISTVARGFYLPLRGADTMATLYRDGLASLKKAEITSRFVKQMQERYQWPLAAAIALLILELFIREQKRVENSAEIRTAANEGLKKAVAAILAGCLVSTAHAVPPSQALRKYADRQYGEALQDYLALKQKHPDDGRYAYNAGAAAYRAGDFQAAVTNFNAALATVDLPVPLQQRSYYNLGNSLFRAGEQAEDPQQKSAQWQQAVERFESALKLDAQDESAKHNRDLVKQKLEELKQQQSKSPQNKSDQKKDDQKNQDQNQGDSKQDPQDQEQKKDQQGQQGQESNDKKQSESKPDQDKQDDSDPGASKPQDQPQPKKQDAPKDKQAQKQGSKEDQKEQQRQAAEQADQAPGQGDPAEQGGQSVPLGQMTPQQAQQLLDTQKGEEKALLFLPPQDAKNGRPRRLRDW